MAKIVDQILMKLVENDESPSVQYIIFNKDSILHKFQYGFADIKNKQRTGEQTTYNAYSVTKTFTALSILQLAEKKKLDIEEPAKKYLPDFPYSSEIKIRHLMTHTAGIPNPIPLSWIHLSDEHNEFDSNTFFDKIFQKNNKIKSKPNENFIYSNLGYVWLGRLIEKVSGLSYEDYVTRNIVQQLDIQSDELDFTIVHMKNNDHAKGYHKKYSFTNIILGLLIDKSKYMDETVGKWNTFKDTYVNGASYGGLIGTPFAFTKYIQELLKPDCKLLSNDSKQMLFTENYTENNQATGMCLSWFTGKLSGQQYFAHAGGGGGYYCEIRIYPYLGIGSVVMFNRTGMSDERYLDKLDIHFIGAK